MAIRLSLTTPFASHASTPRLEPIAAERILSVSRDTSIFSKSLIQSAQDFRGKKFQEAVITVTATFTDAQPTALEKAATAAATTTTTHIWSSNLRTQLVVDLASSSFSISLLFIREELAYVLPCSCSTSINIGGG